MDGRKSDGSFTGEPAYPRHLFLLSANGEEVGRKGGRAGTWTMTATYGQKQRYRQAGKDTETNTETETGHLEPTTTKYLQHVHLCAHIVIQRQVPSQRRQQQCLRRRHPWRRSRHRPYVRHRVWGRRRRILGFSGRHRRQRAWRGRRIRGGVAIGAVPDRTSLQEPGVGELFLLVPPGRPRGRDTWTCVPRRAGGVLEGYATDSRVLPTHG